MRPILTAAMVALTLLGACKSGGGDGDGGSGGGGGTTAPPQPNAPENTATAECGFDLADLGAGSSQVFDCVLDLEGQAVDLASNVTLRFDGGDIVNGTLNFDGGKVDDRLLNSSVTVNGRVSGLRDVFDFYASRWGVVQGVTSSDQALINRDGIEGAIRLADRITPSNSRQRFRINRMNAYFEVARHTEGTQFRPEVEAINIPSGVDIVMTDQTHMRVQPNSNPTYALLSAVRANSLAIYGGTLHGDRNQHTYTAGSTHEWGYLFLVYGSWGVRVQEVMLRDATGDGMKVQGAEYTYAPNFRNSQSVIVERSTFDNNRRNNLSITGSFRNMNVIDSTFLNAGAGGVAPGLAIDVNASRGVDADNNTLIYESVTGVIIRGNTETGSRGGGFAVTSGEDVRIEDNDVQSGLSYALAKDLVFKNNRLTARAALNDVAIRAGQADVVEAYVDNNKVYKNIINGFDTGMHVTGQNVIASGNRINDALVGVVVDQLSNASVDESVIISDRAGSRGIVASDTSLDDVALHDNRITVVQNPIRLSQVNEGAGQDTNNVTVNSNVLRTAGVTMISQSTGVTFNQNYLNDGVEVSNVTRGDFEGNVITSENDHGFHLRQVNTDLLFQNNRIEVPSTRECIQMDASTDTAEVQQISNVCDRIVPLQDPGTPITELPYPEIPDTSYTIDLVAWDIPSNRTDSIKTNQNMQAAIDDAAERGIGTVRIPAGHYLIGEYGNDIYQSGLSLHSNTAYLLDPNAIIEMGPNDKWNYCVLELNTLENVVISGGQIRGDKDGHIFTPRANGSDAHDEGSLICINGTSVNITVHSTIMRNATGDGIIITSGRISRNEEPASEIDIINNDIGYNRRQGISLVGSSNVRIENNEIHHINGTAPQFGIDFEGPGRIQRDAEIRKNYFHHNRGGDIVNTDGLNVLVENNILEQGAGSSYIDGPLVYWKKGDMTVRYNQITMTSMSVNNWNGIIMYSSPTPKTNPATTFIYENICNGCGFYMYYGADLVIRDNLLILGHLAFKDFRNLTLENNRVVGSRGYCWPYRFLRVRGQASGNTLSSQPFDIPLTPNADYNGCWL